MFQDVKVPHRQWRTQGYFSGEGSTTSVKDKGNLGAVAP